MLIRKAAVIGAGTMGGGIACHLANAGVPCLLLDVVPGNLPAAQKDDPRARSSLAIGALARGTKDKPAALMEPRLAALVEPGNIEDHLPRVAECDWIIEAITENLDRKRELYAKIARHRRPGTIVSSNTSGLSLELLVAGLDEEFRRHFLVTHFFNPPRHMYLLEVVRGPETLPAVFDGISRFADVRLGKGVVECKDTPNFIANRIGVFAMAASCRHMLEVGLRIEEVDEIAGPAMGRPKTAAFRLHDLVGVDVALMVMENARRLLPRDASLQAMEPAPFLRRMVEEGKLGRKTGAGFYKKTGSDIQVLDLETFQYRPQQPVAFASLDAARKGKSVAERLRLLVSGTDAAATYAWRNLSETLVYSASLIPEIADDLVSVDRAIRWGFNWELGPFEAWDALGVADVVARLRRDGVEPPPLVNSLLESGAKSFYAATGDGPARRRTVFSPVHRRHEAIPDRPGVILLDDLRSRQKPILGNAEGSVWDVGERVLCVEFHSKMNTISGDTLRLIVEAVDEAERGDWAGLVIGNQGANFSAGANIANLARAAREKKWDEIDAMIRDFHQAALRLRYSLKPVVAAIHGLCLGGGCELPLSCARIQAAAETYIGLVELGVGLIPAGGGTREMACRAAEAMPAAVGADHFPFIWRAFENIGQGRVSGSAVDARELGYLRDCDSVSMNQHRALADARRVVVTLAEAGYQPPLPRNAVRVAGSGGIAEIEVRLHQMLEGGYISEYDAHLGRELARVICGGRIDAENTVTEQYLLDLEREVFVGLCAQEKTLQRIDHMLETGKPLRN